MSGLGLVRGMCLQVCGLTVAHGQELRVWLLTGPGLALLPALPVRDWDLRLIGEGLQPESW